MLLLCILISIIAKEVGINATQKEYASKMWAQKWFVDNFRLKENYAENMKKIVGAVLELPAK